MRRRIFHFPFSIFNSYDVVVRMPRPGVQNWAWYLGSPTHDAVALSSCTVDARGATAACGVWAVSSGPILVENCSFLNFPFGGDTRFEYGVGIGLDATARQMPTNTTVRVTGTLFDASFTNGWALARVGEATNEGAYAVSFSNSLLPAAFPSAAMRRPDATEGLLFGESGVAVTGQLTNEQSLAIGAGPQPRFSRVDLNGLARAATTDIGAFAYTPVPTSATDDTDGDGIFQTTNALTFVARWGDTEVSLPSVVTTKTWTHDFGHRVATRGERAGVHVWGDANHNGVWDEGETGDKYDFKPSGHTTCITNEFAYGHFDRNNNKLPDWWEAETQLSADGRSVKEYEDTDGDGLINLHEFWAGTNPLVPDGSNTLLSVCSRGVDDRIRDIADPSAAVSRFVDFETNGRNGLFVTNANFWARDLDFGCVSVWHGLPLTGSGGKSATAITRRHVVMAQHWFDTRYVFCDTNGTQYVRTIIDAHPVEGTDLRLGRLNEDLPDSISTPKILPPVFPRYVGTGKYLPIVCLTHKKTASVAELATFDCSLRCSDDNIVYNQLGKTEETNYVSSVRKQIRAATVDGLSGSPVFLVVNNQLVFLFSKHMGYRDRLTWAPNWGPMISYHLDTIQSVIDSWEGGRASQYQLSILPMGELNQIRVDTFGGNE